jgi:hypothetical protein
MAKVDRRAASGRITGMKRALVVFVPFVTFAIVSACSESNERAPSLPSCAPGVNCNTGPGVVGSGGGTDSGARDAAPSETAFEVGDGGVTVSAVVRPMSNFVTDPSTVTAFDTTVTLRAPRAGGGAQVEATMAVVDGTYTLNGVAPSIGAPTWIEVLKTGATRTIAGVSAPATGTFALPLFNELLPQTTWNIVAPAAAYPPGSATVVVHVVTPAGVRKAGVTATAFGTARGPYYDDGSDISPSAMATGARGTIVFLGSTGSGTFPISLSFGTKTYATVTAPLTTNAVTHVSLALD